MIQEELLPIILVSACNIGTANNLISEILEEVGAGDGAVWNISNKYYLADVRFCAYADNNYVPAAVNGGPAPAPAAPAPAPPEHDAHIIVLSENEGTKEATARVSASGGLACVRIIASRVASTEELTEWAARERYELISLLNVVDDGSDDEGDDGGVQRVREALQAHMWSNLKRVDRDDGNQDSSESAVERAERFAELLGGLRSIADAATSLPNDDRRAKAETVVAAFCDALDDSDLSDLSSYLDINDAESAL